MFRLPMKYALPVITPSYFSADKFCNKDYTNVFFVNPGKINVLY